MSQIGREDSATPSRRNIPGINAQVERTGAERIFQRVAQECGSNIHAADVVDSSDMSHLLYWKSQGLARAYVPEDVAHAGRTMRAIPDGFYATDRATLSPIGYNTKLVTAGRRAEEFCRPARPEMEGQDRQGASRL